MTTYTKGEYNPKPQTAAILKMALELVNSVPYQVSARWLFYQLYQKGIYSDKNDYKNKFIKAVSLARHASWGGWTPDTLADDTRWEIDRAGNFSEVGSWLDAVRNAKCNLEKWHEQPVYIEIWYEARAMTDQFRYYTQNITLRPMGGQPSIPFKYQTAKDIEKITNYYQMPFVVLYFGDYDQAGETISDVIQRDVRNWCDVDFYFYHCGLTKEQIEKYGIPKDRKKKKIFNKTKFVDTYQWEALNDKAANEIITDAIAQFELRHDAFQEVETEQAKAEAWLKDKLVDLVSDWGQS